ncbi:MAG: hypothetical protein US68_C0001G0026 [Candidatus Shapirobacteria bacterium GW2011_GWE1_38_10]|uniref:Membrane protein 6-pyruvoyl-tetrahydropterin synthase-related domain-containing protein n=1 Tax=Candidatus Shapirobacteria bacterium GW2011_GWE1_38_10 TaxID=1618488 RepID=A0A0G0I8G6_9BACT|nr:MAG: hypothetical protein US46_C0004G0056 [Candidatus Shapirobacteria bacterium GW2011_GWF2_37_20]KKQ50827.1 MAG: hypothetical protein US68_C0001G0026 [Candidatus Shapirobacteria bacterium GW2011_GWE1_38_10]KKQ64874.1 MAG: hypothetical protein US85_C0002G0023 [Candidatus Shapirobacteria bacterium GW2011_GWF1_38_23]
MAPFLWIKRHLFESFLVIILCLLCLNNYTPGTFLTGWDNLMPELNIWLNLKRSLFAVWQQYQGLGLVGGMAHATDLIRQLIILPFTLFLPTSLIRYLWHFAMLFLGTFGIFHLLIKNKFSSLISFVSALFYLLNFGSVQYFWVAFEPFSTFWGFFPWLIFYLFKYLHSPISPNLKKLILINLLAIPSFYVQTIFVVYLICVFLIFVSHFVVHRKTSSLKSYSLFLFLLFLINSFWLFPQLYFLKNNLQNPTAGIGNFMSNDETFARNQSRGNLSDFLLLRGYYYDFSSNGQRLMAPWTTHFSNQYLLICGYFISFFIILGLIYLLSRPKKLNLFSTSLLLFFLLSCVALLSNLGPFKEFNSLLRTLPLINQIFRSPWTKFLVPASFTFSLLLAFGLRSLINFLRQIKYSLITSNLSSFLVFLSLFFFSFPAFKGNYFSPDIRQKIPSEYFEIFNFFNTQNHTGRIANLPQGSFWGWTNYKWGVSGSGFLWYALQNPILDRAFDAWNLENEQYYWELSHAIQSKNPILLENIFSKYSIQYIIFDNNIYYPDDKIYAKLSRPTKELLDSIPSLKLIKKTKNIFVYQTSSPTRIYLTSDLPSASKFNFALIDQNYQLLGDYVTDKNYPSTFQNLFTNRLQSELPFSPSSFSLINNDPANKNSTHSDISQPTFAYNFPNASLSQNYLVKITSRHYSGLPLKISAVSENSQNKYFQTLLPIFPNPATSWFFIPARQSDNFDYGLNFIFDNTSFSTSNLNYIDQITLYPFPLNQKDSYPPLSRQYLYPISNIFYYKAYPTSPASSLILPQSYDSSWIAVNFNHYKINILDHYQVNNWANGWNLENIQNDNIYILFWPQLLEFFGFIFLLYPLFLLLKPQNQPPRNP